MRRTYSFSRAAEGRVLLGLLRSSKIGVVDAEVISKEALVPRSVVEEVLKAYDLRSGSSVSNSKLIEASLRLLEGIGSYEEVSKSLTWKLYEAITARLFSMCGLTVLLGVNLHRISGRAQIDVLALSENAIYVVECKRWARGISTNTLERMLPAMRRRVNMLMDSLLQLFGRGERSVAIVPVILSIYGEPKVAPEVFHLPLRVLKSFLEEPPLTLPSPPTLIIGLRGDLRPTLFNPPLFRVRERCNNPRGFIDVTETS